MVWHLVLMKPRGDLSDADRQALLDAFGRAVREIPTVREVRIGRRVTHGAAYEIAAPDSADFVVSIGFDDLAGLQTYLRHPAHEELAARFYQSLSSALIYDFEVGGNWRCGSRQTSGTWIRFLQRAESCGASRARAAATRRAACAACRPAWIGRTPDASGYDDRRTISASSAIVRSSPVPTLMCGASS